MAEDRLGDADLAALTERRWGDVQYGSKDSWNGTLQALARELQEARAAWQAVCWDIDEEEGLSYCDHDEWHAIRTAILGAEAGPHVPDSFQSHIAKREEVAVTAERARIVAWLREQGAGAMRTPNHYDLSQRSGPQHVLEWAADRLAEEAPA